ncbi:MAG: phage tail length tape measure family protein [Pseudomonadota bacterium]|nr:phage tail length tape measure family protein [Pseudomonadota bacterium]
MSDTDIIARLTLNARQFSTEFANVVKKTAGDAKDAGKAAGKEFNTGLSEMLENPDINSGSFKFGFKAYNLIADGMQIATRGALAFATASVAAVAASERWRIEADALGSVLEATGQRAGWTKDQLVDFARETAAATGTSVKEVLEAEKQLANFAGIAGSNFTDAIELGADLAEVFGGDVSSNTVKLGKVLSTLARGEVDGLRASFGNLDEAVLSNIETLARSGREFESQRALIDALDESLGEASESGKGGGLTGALLGAKTAFESLAVSFGSKVGDFLGLEERTRSLADELERLAGIEPSGAKLDRQIAAAQKQVDALLNSGNEYLITGAGMKNAQGRLGGLLGIKQRQGVEGAAADAVAALETQSQAAIAAATRYVEEQIKAEKKLADERVKLGERAAREAEKLLDAYDKQLLATERKLALLHAEREGNADLVTLAHEIADIEAQFAGKIAPDKLDRLKDITSEYAEQKRLAEEASSAVERLDPGALVDFEGDLDTWKDAQKEIMAQEKRQNEQRKREFNDLADVYERAFRDGSGSIWDQFKSMGKRAIAELLAAWTLGGTGGAGTLLGSLGLGGLLPGGGGGGILNLLGGGSGGGQSFNMIQSRQLPGGGTFSLPDLTGGGAGGASGILSGASSALGAFGLAVGVNQMIGDIFGFKGGPLGILTGPLKSILSPNRTSNAVLTGMGAATTGGKGSKQDVALGLAGNVQDSLSQIAEALGVDVGSFYTTIGVRGGDYRVNTGGSSLKIKNGAKNFGEDAEAAVEYAIRDAIGDGAFSGKISAAAERALKNTSKSIEDAIEDALTIESIPKRLREIEDPIGAAVDKVVEDFTKLRDTMVANGATAQQLADAEKLFNYEREAALERTESTLRDFLEGLKLGGNSPLSLRDQSATAEAAFAKYEADIAAGKAVDQAGFAEASQAALDVKRQTDGSTQGYFDLYNRVVSAGNAAQGRIDSTGAGRNDTNPFAKPTAEAAATTANNTATLPAILNQLQQIAGQLSKVGGGGLAYGNFGFVR